MINDPEKFKEIQEYCEDLEGSYSGRDEQAKKMEDAFEMVWEIDPAVKEKFQGIVPTKSPDARNTIDGVVKLMSVNETQIKIPRVETQNIDKETADRIEKFAQTMLRASDRIRGARLVSEGAKSLTLWDEMYIGITSTKDIVDHTKKRKGNGGNALLSRAENIARKTPFIFQIFEPRTCYPSYDGLGMNAILRKVQMYPKEIRSTFGEDAIEGKGNDELTVKRYWDMEYYATWIEGKSEPIEFEENSLPFIPIISTIGNGSMLFDDPKMMREPLLYAYVESGLLNRTNLSLTAIYTTVQAIGLWPTLLFHAAMDTDDLPEIDTTHPWAIIKLLKDQKLEPLYSKGLIDPGLMEALEIAERKGQESTIYKQTLGQPLGAGASFSETALLHQAGRLPLVNIKDKLGWAIGDAMRTAFLWMKEMKGSQKTQYNNYLAEIKTKDIPDTLEIEVNIDVTLPQEALQMANIFGMLDGKVSLEWLLENILKVEQPSEMMDKIRTEQALNMMFMKFMQDKLTAEQQPINLGGQMQPGMQPGMQQGMQTPMPAQGGEMAQQEGMPLQGLPQVMEQGGMQPPMQPGYEQAPEQEMASPGAV